VTDASHEPALEISRECEDAARDHAVLDLGEP